MTVTAGDRRLMRHWQSLPRRQGHASDSTRSGLRPGPRRPALRLTQAPTAAQAGSRPCGAMIIMMMVAAASAAGWEPANIWDADGRSCQSRCSESREAAGYPGRAHIPTADGRSQARAFQVPLN